MLRRVFEHPFRDLFVYVHFVLNLTHFWRPLAHFGFPLAHFWLTFGALWLTFGALGSLLAILALDFLAFGAP